MKRFLACLRSCIARDPGGALLVLAVVLVVAIYAPTLGRGLINYDDPWLLQDNWLLQQPSLTTLRTIAFDLSRDTRAVLGAEYLPVRDLSVMADAAVWGAWWPGYHLTSLALYLGAIVVWFAALTRLGFDRRHVGLAILLWAVHPTHAESVAWLSERKGLLGLLFAGITALGYAGWRTGGRRAALFLAVFAGLAAVWSKAPSAFALAALAGLEMVAPVPRGSVRRALMGIAAIGLVAAVAFVPVVVVATRMSVVGGDAAAPAGWLAMVLGVLGFYAELGAMVVPNAVSYPLSDAGPGWSAIALGGGVLALLVGLIAVPGWAWWRPTPIARAAAVIWVAGWFPVSRILLPVKSVIVADRYLLFPSLGLALGGAALILLVRRVLLRRVVTGVVVLALALRAFVAQAGWADAQTLWGRAVVSNPADDAAWDYYIEALDAAGEPALAARALALAEVTAPSPLLAMRRALMELRVDRARGVAHMRRAATQGEPRAMTNLALLIDDDGHAEEALQWARRAVALRPLYANGYRILGKVALRQRALDEAHAAFQRALALEPLDAGNRLNLAIVLIELGRPGEARPLIEACIGDSRHGAAARQLRALLP